MQSSKYSEKYCLTSLQNLYYDFFDAKSEVGRNRRSVIISDFFADFECISEEIQKRSCFYILKNSFLPKYDDLLRYTQNGDLEGFANWYENNPSEMRYLINYSILHKVREYIKSDDNYGFDQWCGKISLDAKEIDQYIHCYVNQYEPNILDSYIIGFLMPNKQGLLYNAFFESSSSMFLYLCDNGCFREITGDHKFNLLHLATVYLSRVAYASDSQVNDEGQASEADNFEIDVEKSDNSVSFTKSGHSVAIVDSNCPIIAARAAKEQMNMKQADILAIFTAILDSGIITDLDQLTGNNVERGLQKYGISSCVTALRLSVNVASECDKQFFQLLLKHGANPNVGSFVNLPIYRLLCLYASRKLSVISFVKLLFEYGYNVNCSQDEGTECSILHVAIKAVYCALGSSLTCDELYSMYEEGEQIIKLILEHEIDLSVKNCHGVTALEFAEHLRLCENSKIEDIQLRKELHSYAIEYYNDILQLIEDFEEQAAAVEEDSEEQAITVVTKPDIQQPFYTSWCSII